ncbi:MAG: hypothetical protein ACI9LO_000606 [Planctomycetota bacterium]|jgi:hypothetical protein
MKEKISEISNAEKHYRAIIAVDPVKIQLIRQGRWLENSIFRPAHRARQNLALIRNIDILVAGRFFPWNTFLNPSNYRHALAGYLLLAMVVVTILNGLFDLPLPFNSLWIAGACAWVAGLLLFKDASIVLKIQVSVIAVTGAGMIGWAGQHQVAVDVNSIITANTGLLSMIAAVGFLKLVVVPKNAPIVALPVGPKAYLQTLIGLTISSSVINISAPILIADRIHQQRPIDRFTAQSFVRIFCGVSSWSPFFGAMAVVLTYIENAQLIWLMLAGLPFTLIGFLVVYGEARLRYRNEMNRFIGYPMQFSALLIPLVLIFTVAAGAWLLPDTAILVVISLAALLVTSSTLLLRGGWQQCRDDFAEQVVTGLPRIVNELTLFLAAGVLATGIAALIKLGVLDNPFTVFDSDSAMILLLIMWLAAAIGIHPVIMISGFAPMILSLDPDPHLLGATFLFAWHLGTCSSPLSGTNLVFQGRYQLSGWKIAVGNWPYALVMLIVAYFWFQLIASFLPAI